MSCSRTSYHADPSASTFSSENAGIFIPNRMLSKISRQHLQGYLTSLLLDTIILFCSSPSQTPTMAAYRHVLAYTFVLLAFALGIRGTALRKCEYQEYVCGNDLSKRGMSLYLTRFSTVFFLIFEPGYTYKDLRAAIAKLPPGIIPPNLSNVQLLQVLYHCDDIYNSISGNAFCVSGCIVINGSLANDQCYMYVKDDRREGDQFNNNVQEWLHCSSNQKEETITR